MFVINSRIPFGHFHVIKSTLFRSILLAFGTRLRLAFVQLARYNLLAWFFPRDASLSASLSARLSHRNVHRVYRRMFTRIVPQFALLVSNAQLAAGIYKTIATYGPPVRSLRLCIFSHRNVHRINCRVCFSCIYLTTSMKPGQMNSVSIN